MRFNLRRAAAASAVVGAALALAAPAFASGGDPYLGTDTTSPAATIGGAGSTFAAPLEDSAIGAYSARNPNASFNAYQAIGSGAGEQDLLTSASTGVNWGGTDVPLGASDITKICGTAGVTCPKPTPTLASFEQVPIALGGVAIVYNVPGLKTGLKLNGAVLANIYHGKITTWNNAAIHALNPGVTLPNHVIHPIFREDSSGTSYIFTNFLSTSTGSTPPTGSTSSTPTGSGGRGAWPFHPSKNELNTYSGVKNGYAFPHNGGVASGIASTSYSIGYVEYSYVLLNPKLKNGVASILNGDGKFLQPTPAGITADAALFPGVNATNFSIVFGKSATAYPICGYTWALVWKVQSKADTDLPNGTIASQTGTLLVKYLDWLSHSGTTATGKAGQDFAADDGYVAMPTNVQALATATLLKVVNSAGHVLL